jgi:hypothetical protein
MKPLLSAALSSILFVCLGCHSAIQPHATSPSQTQDSADAVLNTPASKFGIQIAGYGSNDGQSPLTKVTPPNAVGVVACDKFGRAYLSDAAKPGNNDDYWVVGTLNTPQFQQMRICSYGIMNGPVAQHIQITGGNPISGQNGLCQIPDNSPGSYNPGVQLEYDLAPYETITRGTGVGVVALLLPGANYCIHRVPAKSADPKALLGPVAVEVTYAGY